MTLAEKLATAVANQQAEVDRLTAQLQIDLPAARAKLTQLQTLQTRVTATLETILTTLHQVGLRLDE